MRIDKCGFASFISYHSCRYQKDSLDPLYLCNEFVIIGTGLKYTSVRNSYFLKYFLFKNILK